MKEHSNHKAYHKSYKKSEPNAGEYLDHAGTYLNDGTLFPITLFTEADALNDATCRSFMPAMFEQASPELILEFKRATHSIVEQLYRRWNRHNFYTLLRFYCEQWVSQSDHASEYTAKMQHQFYDIILHMVLYVYKIDPKKLAPEHQVRS